MIFKSASSVGDQVVEGILNSTDDEDSNMQPTPSRQPSKRRRGTHKNVAQILNIDSVTPRMIAYAAVMASLAMFWLLHASYLFSPVSFALHYLT